MTIRHTARAGKVTVKRRVNTRSGLIERNPDVANLLGCLDALERLAPSPETDSLDPSNSSQQQPVEQGTALPGSSDSASVTFGKYELIEEVGRGGVTPGSG